ncbi:hypothetical protein [Streptomyces erythrochromogenes]|uniref:hypothetical protein n=1 Tax=Streptomyces erythrochromogenes TaxID=285574 RepID=UPI0036AAB433
MRTQRNDRSGDERKPERAPTWTREAAPQGLLALQGTVGNEAVVQRLQQAGYLSTARPDVQGTAVHDVPRAPGRPLDDATCTDMESRLGADSGAGLQASDPSDRFEREAEAGARRVLSGPGPQGGLPGADAPPAAGGGSSPSSLPVQRVFEGGLSGYTTAQAIRELKEQVPGSAPKWSVVDAARTGATAYGSLGDLASALGLQAPQQAGTTPAPAVAPASTASASTATASTATAATTPARPPRPAPKPKPAKFTRTEQQPGSAAAARKQVPSTPTPAPRTRSDDTHTHTPAPAAAVPAEERRPGVAEQVSVEDFAANSAQARDELEAERAAPRSYLRRRAASRLNDSVFQQMAGSVKLNNKAQLLPHLIDQLYSCLEWTGRAPIAVFTHEAQGKGDLMLGVKTADALRENFPRTEANKNDIALLTAEAAHSKQPGVFEDSGHPFTVLDGATPAAPRLDSGKAPTHAIVAPQLAATKNFQKSVGAWGSTVSSMTEYSKKESLPPGAHGTGYTTGLGAGEVGITFDAGLRAYKQHQDSIEGEENKRAARLENLQALKSKDLLTSLFPEEQERAAKEYAAAATSRLYFAYSNKSAMRFALTVAEVENGNDNDVHVVQSSPTRMPELDATVKRDLAGLGVGKVRLVEVSSREPAPTVTVQDTGGAGKTMHWITTDRVPHDDMLTLIKASEPIVMTTGNQSTSEALSAGKTIMYESIGMEQSKAFRQSLYAGAGVAPADIESMAAVSRDYDQRGTRGPGQPEFKAAAAALQNMQQEDRMGAFSDRASATKDLGRWIGGQHLRDFLMKTELAPELQRREEQLKSEYRKADAYKGFVDHLLALPGGEE